MRAIAALLLLSVPATAHEFWIQPTDYTPAPGEAIAADTRVGQEFVGSSYAYVPSRTERFDLIGPDGTTPVEGLPGDKPALAETVLPEGLNVIVHETGDMLLTYKEDGKIQSFAEHKGFGDMVEAETVPVKEKYRRFAKSLVGVGNAAGADAPVGLRVELVAQANPYTDDLSAGLPVLLLEDGAPVPDYQIELFARPLGGEEVTITKHMTDAAGIALLPIAPGTEYMADSVLMRPWDGDEAKWYSLWANLTFAVPG